MFGVSNVSEALHDVLKNELAAGVMRFGRFGANAAWLRLVVMTHNVTALEAPDVREVLAARLKRMALSDLLFAR